MQFKHLLLFLTTTLCLLIGLFLILSWQPSKNNSDHPQIVCTTTIIADAIKHITNGCAIDLKILMGPGVDPHVYKPVEQDIITIANADIIFYNGLHLEARMADIFEQLALMKKTVAVTSDMPKEKLIYSKEFSQYPDPHVWFDPELWTVAVATVAQNMALLMPEHATLFEKNKNEYIAKIQSSYQATKKQMLQIPQAKRFLITGHDAFSYFARAYDCNVISLQGISTACEAGTCDVQNLINFIVQHKIPTIFAESCIPTRNMQALIQGSRAHGWPVHLGKELFSDALGSTNTAQETYLGMLEYNVTIISDGMNFSN